MIEQNGMTFDNDFGYSSLLFSSFLKKSEQENNNQSRCQKSCLSARSFWPIYDLVVGKMRQKSWSKLMPFCSIGQNILGEYELTYRGKSLNEWHDCNSHSNQGPMDKYPWINFFLKVRGSSVCSCKIAGEHPSTF